MQNKFRRFIACLLVTMLMSSDIAVLAEEVIKTLTLPAALQIIDEEAFYGNTSIEKVVVPDGTTEIRSKAFANSSLTEIELPASLTFIADDAFEGCGEFVLTVPENCYAYDRCVELGLIKVSTVAQFVEKQIRTSINKPFDVKWIGAANAVRYKLCVLDENYGSAFGKSWIMSASATDEKLLITRAGTYYVRLYTFDEENEDLVYNGDISSVPYSDMTVVVSDKTTGDFVLSAVENDGKIIFSTDGAGSGVTLYKSGQVSVATSEITNGVLTMDAHTYVGLNSTYQYTPISNKSYVFCAITSDGRISNSILAAGTDVCETLPTTSDVVMSVDAIQKGDSISFNSGTVLGNDLRIYGVEAYFENVETGETFQPAVWDSGYVWSDGIDLSPFDLSTFEPYTLMSDKEPGKYRICVDVNCYGNVLVTIPTSTYVMIEEQQSSDDALPESDHPYANNTDKTWEYVHPEPATALRVVFSSDTELEQQYDTLTIINSVGEEVQYTGTELAGVELTLPGNRFTLRLKTDGSVQKYGFRIISITAVDYEDPDIPLPIPEIDMSNAALDKNTYRTGDIITISGIRVRNADYVHFSGNNGYLSTADIRITNDSSWQTLEDVKLTLPDYAVEGDFYISVRPINDHGTEGDIDTTTLTYKVQNVDLPIPSITEVEYSDKDEVRIEWTEVEDIDGVYLYRSTSSDFTTDVVKATIYNYRNFYVDSGLVGGTTYYYRLQAFVNDDDGSVVTGDFGTVWTHLFVIENPMEGYPTITSVDTIDSYSLKINWTRVVGAEGYRIWRENAATGEGEYLDDVIGGTVCSYTDTKLEPNTTYAYTVAAYAHAVTENAIYISLDSNTVEGTTSEEVVSELAAPIINEIELRDATSLTIRWSEVENAEGFLIYRADSADGEFVEIDRYNFVYQHHVDRDLITGKTYYYKVQAFAYSDSGRMYTGAMSAAEAGTPALDNPMNGVPAITAAEALDCTRVKITWTSVEGAEGYNLRREDLATGKTTSTRINSASTLTYIDTGLSPATTYAYTLEAYAKALVTDTTYISEDSNTVNVTTETEAVIELDTPDIDDISVLSGNTSVSIEWTSISNATGYYLYRSTNTSDNFEIVQTINGATTTTDTQLIQGTKYYYRIQAYAVGSAGTVFTSEWSGKFAVTMPETIDAPTIYVIACGPSSISITWNEISNAEDYLVYRSYTKDSGFSKIAETKDPFYIDSNVAVDIQVYYKVKARTANGLTSSYSNRDSDYIDSEDYVEEIDAPDVTSITVLSGTSLKVRWSYIDNAVKYYIYRSTQGASKGFEKVGEATGQVFTDTGLSPNTKYWYRIRAISGSGTESVLGVTDSATTGSGSGGSDYEDILVTSVVIDPSALNLSIGESYSLYADIRPSNATNPSVNWKSNNTAVATVSASGKVTAVKAGTATITATAADGSGKTDTCLVTVTAATSPVVSTPSVSGYSLTPSVVAVGETFKLNGILSGNGATIEKITISAFPAGRHADDGVRVYTYAPKTETFNLNNVPAIKTGYTYTDSEGDSMSLDADESYDILIYAALSNGEYFRNDSNPSQMVTVTAAATTEPFVRVYGVDNADLNGKTLSFAYNKFSGKTIYVLTNIDIMPWSSDEDAFNITYQSVEYTDEGTLYELAVNGSENPYADQRTGELRIYENGKVGTSSPWATIKVKQAGNPNVPVIVSAALDDDGVAFNRSNPLKMIGTYGMIGGFDLIVNTQNDIDVDWYVYTDDDDIASAKIDDSGILYIQVNGCGTTSVYISHIKKADYAEIEKEHLYWVCDINVMHNNIDKCLIVDHTLLNPSLATISVDYAAEAYTGASYVKQMLEWDGFSVPIQKHYDKPELDHYVAYSIGKKVIPTSDGNKTVYAVIIRGTYDSVEWLYDFNAGTGTYHLDFLACANEIYRDLLSLQQDSDIDVRVWVTGHSRGAGIANIVAKKCFDNSDISQVFAYTFASPAVTTQPDSSLDIHNYMDAGDLITMLPMSKWGFGVHGQVYKFGSRNNSVERLVDQVYNLVGGSREKFAYLYQQVADVVQEHLIAYPDLEWDEVVAYYLIALDNATIAELLLQGAIKLDDLLAILANVLSSYEDIYAAHEQGNYVTNIHRIFD